MELKNGLKSLKMFELHFEIVSRSVCSKLLMVLKTAKFITNQAVVTPCSFGNQVSGLCSSQLFISR